MSDTPAVARGEILAHAQFHSTYSQLFRDTVCSRLGAKVLHPTTYLPASGSAAATSDLTGRRNGSVMCPARFNRLRTAYDWNCR